MTNYTVPEFVLEHVFHKETCSDGKVFFWRDCILTDNMSQGEQGYMVYYPNSDYLHTYRYPPDWAKY
jgi:hypothetical protein